MALGNGDLWRANFVRCDLVTNSLMKLKPRLRLLSPRSRYHRAEITSPVLVVKTVGTWHLFDSAVERTDFASRKLRFGRFAHDDNRLQKSPIWAPPLRGWKEILMQNQYKMDGIFECVDDNGRSRLAGNRLGIFRISSDLKKFVMRFRLDVLGGGDLSGGDFGKTTAL